MNDRSEKMAVPAQSDESFGNKKTGMRIRRDSDAAKRYQGGARASVDDVKDHGLEIMDKMGGLTISMGTLSHTRPVRYLVAFITDESTAAGFALVGALETGISPSQARIATEKPQIQNVNSKKNREKTFPDPNFDPEKIPKTSKYGSLGRKNFFIVKQGTSQEELERAFKILTRRDDIAILAINGDIMERIKTEIKRHDVKAALPIIVPMPIDDDPFKCIEDGALERPKNLGFLNLNDPLQLFHQIEHEFEHDLYHFHNIGHDKHDHHHHQGHHY